MNIKRIGIGFGTALATMLTVAGSAMLYDVAARKAARRREGHAAVKSGEGAAPPAESDAG